MKLKKIISALTASAVLASALPVYSGLLTFADDTDETGNSQLDTIDISFNEIISDTLEWADDDWYKFTLSTSGKVNMTLIISRLDNFVNFDIIDVSDDNNKVIVSDDSG